MGSVSGERIECLAAYRKGVPGAGVPGFGEGGVSITRVFQDGVSDASESNDPHNCNLVGRLYSVCSVNLFVLPFI